MCKPRLLDLFCCAGGAARGYQLAGFHVTGVDIVPQPRYIGDEFHQGDALEYVAAHGHEFDAIHASPPCQGYSVTRHISGREHPMLVGETRAALLRADRPYVIENVMGAPLIDPVVLCGTMFGLRVYRHRQFETSFFMLQAKHMPHPKGSTTNSARSYSSLRDGATHITAAGHNFNREDAMAAMGLDWPMTREEVAQSIPPAYTEYVGAFLMDAVREAQSVQA